MDFLSTLGGRMEMLQAVQTLGQNSIKPNERKIQMTQLVKSTMAALIISIIFITQSFADSIVVNENGNVGIGTTTPLQKLSIKNGSAGSGGHTWSGYSVVGIENGTHLEIELKSPNNTSQSIKFSDQDAGAVGMIYYDHHQNTMTFKTNSQDRLRIDGSGRIGIGTISPSYKLDVNGTIRGNNVSPSDARWKTEIKPIENSLDKISKLNGVSFQWTDKSKGNGTQIGLIAQNVETVFPEAVSEDAEGYKSVAYANLIGPLVESVKELKKENQILKRKIASLEARIK